MTLAAMVEGMQERMQRPSESGNYARPLCAAGHELLQSAHVGVE